MALSRRRRQVPSAVQYTSSLRASVPAFPRPPEYTLLETLVDRLVPSG